MEFMKIDERNWFPRFGSFDTYGDSTKYGDPNWGRFVITRKSKDLPTNFMDKVNHELEQWIDQNNSIGWPLASNLSRNRFTIILDYPHRLDVVQTEMIKDTLEKMSKLYPIKYYNQREMTKLEWAEFGIEQLRGSDQDHLSVIFENLIEDYNKKCKTIEKLTQDLNDVEIKHFNDSQNSDSDSEIDNSDNENMENNV
jgi:hypothetical protein